LITGVGFIGGGAILKHGRKATGTATAASLWGRGLSVQRSVTASTTSRLC